MILKKTAIKKESILKKKTPKVSSKISLKEKISKVVSPKVPSEEKTSKVAPFIASPKVSLEEKAFSIFENRKYIYAIGRRKRATAQVRYYENGKGEIIVNNQDFRKYFPFFIWQKNITDPLEKVKKNNEVDISVLVKGGGKNGQSQSIRHGIARILAKIDPKNRLILKKYGFLTRDSREKERKKPGLKKARRAPQWAKR